MITKEFLTIVENATPYDVVYNKERFLDLIKSDPKFEKQFNEQLSEELIKAAEEMGWYFIYNIYAMPRYLFDPVLYEDNIRLSKVGREGAPTISFNHYVGTV